jgi:hypothetical protein
MRMTLTWVWETEDSAGDEGKTCRITGQEDAVVTEP